MFEQLEELDMSDNRLISLEAMRDLPQKAPNVKKLNLGKNKVSNIGITLFSPLKCVLVINRALISNVVKRNETFD